MYFFLIDWIFTGWTAKCSTALWVARLFRHRHYPSRSRPCSRTVGPTCTGAYCVHNHWAQPTAMELCNSWPGACVCVCVCPCSQKSNGSTSRRQLEGTSSISFKLHWEISTLKRSHCKRSHCRQLQWVSVPKSLACTTKLLNKFLQVLRLCCDI